MMAICSFRWLMLTCSILCAAFIPGSYASYQLYGSFKGWKGYDYSQIPSYDD